MLAWLIDSSASLHKHADCLAIPPNCRHVEWSIAEVAQHVRISDLDIGEVSGITHALEDLVKSGHGF